MDKDISKNLLFSLMILAIVITFIGTFLVVSSLEGLKSVDSYEEKPATGQVGINILEKPTPDVEGGKVGITILNQT